MAYGVAMLDVMLALKERRQKAEGRVTRAAKALESAQKDLADVIATERVMAEITGESVEPKLGGGHISDRDRDIARLLDTGEEAAKSPAELYPIYIAEHGDSLNLEAFRTALWRLQKKVIQGTEKTWAVKAENGRYWREAHPSPDDFDVLLGGDSDDP